MNWMIVLSLAQASQDTTVEEMARAMVEGSPELAEGKAGHMAGYVARTVGKALVLVGQDWS